MSKYTPGPWTETAPEVAFKIDENYRQIKAGQGFHAEDGGGFCLTGFISPENARLLAAAPDLLEALIDLRDEQEGPPLVRRYMQWQNAMDKATAAIRKAEGEL